MEPEPQFGSQLFQVQRKKLPGNNPKSLESASTLSFALMYKFQVAIFPGKHQGARQLPATNDTTDKETIGYARMRKKDPIIHRLSQKIFYQTVGRQSFYKARRVNPNQLSINPSSLSLSLSLILIRISRFAEHIVSR